MFFVKQFLPAFLVLVSFFSKAQKIDSIFINLYTDSLKKGSFNYINVEGHYSDGTYLPLDSTEIIFTSSYGKFYGNSLWLDSNIKKEKINIKVTLRNNQTICKDFVMYLKKKEDNEKLMTNKEMLDKIKNDQKKKNKKN